MSDVATKIEEQVERFAEEHGLSLTRGWRKAVAERLGISPEHLSRLTSGARRPSAALLAKIDRGIARTDPELAAMEALATLPDDARRRVVAWSSARWGPR